ncbi:hypothetical protein [Aneurinibacillus tyrosinisolvens]|uniref:hypothetical protein n=1 Tax=Aneurinibacillus tyrosinisolvens TaxID=1443435 RepID=UPI00063F6DFE|nr:hypothetical protein [Aneurinibacillus tyrosinisolvens]
MLPTALLQRLAGFVGSGETKLSSEQELMEEMFHNVTPEEYAKLSAAIYDNREIRVVGSRR